MGEMFNLNQCMTNFDIFQRHHNGKYLTMTLFLNNQQLLADKYLIEKRSSLSRKSTAHIHNPFFSSHLMNGPNKLECLSQKILSSLM